MLTISLALLAYYVSTLQGVTGQGTSAICQAAYSWMSNDKDQSPCLVASYLLSPCSTPAASWVYPLTPGYHYNTPTDSPTSATSCRCSTVFYSMISACATCQGLEIDVVPYPDDIPSVISVPAWAYIDITRYGTFSAVAAEEVASQDAPDSTGLATATGSNASPTQGSSGNTNNSGSSTGKKSTNIGAIVGGAVGGVVGLIAIGLVIFFWMRHRRNAARDAPTGPLDLTAGEHGHYVEKPFEHEAMAAPLPSPKLYDPDDPSTFPTSLDNQAPSFGGSTTLASPVHPTMSYAYPAPGGYQSHSGAGTNPAYKGIPEL
ncbi:hypothetical protein ONZ51_g4144 [Trametes cubensis]|uniref:Uncharacterized protein n=1 Tax=Trametes cubensis TaxID=1111947 RepID=A0AAD7XEZ1_9APHY|nr:hypothetical protein ONZ51_g4144 [Trametes cubensis]